MRTASRDRRRLRADTRRGDRWNWARRRVIYASGSVRVHTRIAATGVGHTGTHKRIRQQRVRVREYINACGAHTSSRWSAKAPVFAPGSRGGGPSINHPTCDKSEFPTRSCRSVGHVPRSSVRSPVCFGRPGAAPSDGLPLPVQPPPPPA